MSYLTACAMYLNEGPFLEEWIEFHRLVGFERFFLYNHMSTDEHRDVLAPYVEDGTVFLKDWPDEPGQFSAYMDCLEEHRDEARWIAFIDLDEFLFSPTFAPVSEVLKDYEQWPGVSVNWAVFGPGGYETRPEGLLIENYTQRTLDKHPFNRMCKCVVDPKRTIGPGGGVSAHRFDFTEGFAVDENFGLRDKKPGQTPVRSWTRLRINHYYMRSRQQWMEKLAVPKADTGLPYPYDPAGYDEMAATFSMVRDETILEYLPALKAAIAETRDRYEIRSR
jgi:glycosyl transferase family 92